MNGRSFFVPEVVQTSAMDCGPAALKALLEGHGIRASYGRLREACQTSVDGTSIDALEDLAGKLGLDAEQVMVPLDQLLLDETSALPALLVTVQPNGLTHFIVVWRRHGDFVQVMDPGVGRRWMRAQTLLAETYLHTATVAAAGWREYAASDEFLAGLGKRLAALGVADRGRALIGRALADPGYRSLAALDAAVRMTEALRRPSGLPSRRLAALLEASLDDALAEPPAEPPRAIPAACWQVRPAPAAGPEGEEQLLLSGAVLVRIKGRSPAPLAANLSPELSAALEETPLRPGLALLKLLFAGGPLEPLLLVGTLCLLALGTMLEALLLRGLVDVGNDLGAPQQRLAALGALLVFLVLLLAVDLPVISGTLRLARRLEISLRAAFLEKIPRLGDRYLTSRPISDMADRSHAVHQLRDLPELSRRFLRACLEILVTAAGLCWLDPRSAPLAALAALFAIGVPLLFQPQLLERDHRQRVHGGALSRFNLDALLGLTAVRAHGAERSLRREHESLLVEWARAARSLLHLAVAAEGAQLFSGLLLSGLLLVDYLRRAGEGGGVLLFAYWTMNLPMLGQELASLLRQYPARRNLTLRLLEPLGALEEAEPPAPAVAPGVEVAPAGARIELQDVTVLAGGHGILHDVTLQIPPGSHLAIVGPSGAGKSSLVGLLLGWLRPARGRLLVDGEELLGSRQDALRAATAWVDPAVQIWNRTLLSNLRYGEPAASALPLTEALEKADLLRVLEGLPEGLQTPLGEGGGLLSGGEGQRVRLGRSLFRTEARLVILDEPFRGLDRPLRSELLARVRRHFAGATLLCVTHDVGETQKFARVLVVEDGRVVEDGAPAELSARQGSRYRALLDAEDELRRSLFAGDEFRKVWLEGRALREEKATR